MDAKQKARNKEWYSLRSLFDNENEMFEIQFVKRREKKQSDFYPNADEDGMVDVSDYPYTK